MHPGKCNKIKPFKPLHYPTVKRLMCEGNYTWQFVSRNTCVLLQRKVLRKILLIKALKNEAQREKLNEKEWEEAKELPLSFKNKMPAHQSMWTNWSGDMRDHTKHRGELCLCLRETSLTAVILWSEIKLRVEGAALVMSTTGLFF